MPRTNLDDHFRDVEEKTRTGERLIASMHNNPEPDLSNIVIPPLLKELIIYHQDFRPHEHANVEFHKIDSAND